MKRQAMKTNIPPLMHKQAIEKQKELGLPSQSALLEMALEMLLENADVLKKLQDVENENEKLKNDFQTRDQEHTQERDGLLEVSKRRKDELNQWKSRGIFRRFFNMKPKASKT